MNSYEVIQARGPDRCIHEEQVKRGYGWKSLRFSGGQHRRSHSGTRRILL